MTVFERALAALAKLDGRKLSEEGSTAQFAFGDDVVVATSVSPSLVLVNLVRGDEVSTIPLAGRLSEAEVEKQLQQLIAARKPDPRIEHPLTPEREVPATRERKRLSPLPDPTISFDETRRRPGDMPDFDDEYEIKKGLRVQPPPVGGLPSIGSQDLDPVHPQFTPYLGPGAGGPVIGDGGMVPLKDHPLFRGGGRQAGRPGLPPGARYDEPFGGDNLDGFGGNFGGNFGGGPPNFM